MSEMVGDHGQLASDLLDAVAPADREAFLRGLDAVGQRLGDLVAAAEAQERVKT